MADLNELIDAGHRYVRLPAWTKNSYLRIREGGVWADLVTLSAVGSPEPVPVLVAQAALHDTWEPVEVADDPDD